MIVSDEPQEILEAIDDRAITRLVVEDGPPDETALDPEAVASARGRIVTCLAYSPTGRVAEPDVRIASNPVTEGYVEAILDPEARARAAAEPGRQRRAGGCDRAADGGGIPGHAAEDRRFRADLVENGAPVETYRRIGLAEALARLGSAGSRRLHAAMTGNGSGPPGRHAGRGRRARPDRVHGTRSSRSSPGSDSAEVLARGPGEGPDLGPHA